MLGLPKSTNFDKPIPKKKFYENLEISPALKRVFVECVRSIHWRNKIAPETTNLSPGKRVGELQVFEIKLSRPIPNDDLLRQIDRKIPYHILFLLELDGRYQAWIGYKQVSELGTKAHKMGNYYHTEWCTEQELGLVMDGLSVDEVYENYVRQIAGDLLNRNSSAERLQESVERSERKQTLQKRIDALTAKINKEKQLNKQMEYNAERKKLRKEWEEL